MLPIFPTHGHVGVRVVRVVVVPGKADKVVDPVDPRRLFAPRGKLIPWADLRSDGSRGCVDSRVDGVAIRLQRPVQFYGPPAILRENSEVPDTTLGNEKSWLGVEFLPDLEANLHGQLVELVERLARMLRAARGGLTLGMK